MHRLFPGYVSTVSSWDYLYPTGTTLYRSRYSSTIAVARSHRDIPDKVYWYDTYIGAKMFACDVEATLAVVHLLQVPGSRQVLVSYAGDSIPGTRYDTGITPKDERCA